MLLLIGGVGVCVLVACSNDNSPIEKEQQDDTPILLSAVADNGNETTTRSNGEYIGLPENTPLYIRVQANWPQQSESPIVKVTDAVAQAKYEDPTSSNKYYNDLTQSPQLTWDMFGSNDPDNTVGRADGLTIYGTGIADGITSAPRPLEGDWNTFEWVVRTSGTWAQLFATDLIYSNNIDKYQEGTLKYSNPRPVGLMKFRHAMSMVTVNIKAGDGFTDNKFVTDPKMYLTSNRAGETELEYAYTKGRVNIPSGLVTPDDGSGRVIELANVNANGGYETVSGEKIYTYRAFLFPGSHLKRPTDNDIQVKIVADGNTYYVKAQQMNTKMMENPGHNSPVTKQGHNYIWTVTLNKQDIEKLEATITEWNTIEVTYPTPLVIE